MPQPLLWEALRTARRIMGEAGVAIEWRFCSADRNCEETPPGVPVVEFVRTITVRGLARAAFGVSQWSYLALVVVDRVERLVTGREGERAVLMGHVIAHELGHLLLETPEHSVEGIMRARWRQSDLDKAAQGLLLFHPSQGPRMQMAAHTRVLRALETQKFGR